MIKIIIKKKKWLLKRLILNSDQRIIHTCIIWINKKTIQ